MFNDILGFYGCKDIDCGLYTKECAVSHSGYNWILWCMLLILSRKSVSSTQSMKTDHQHRNSIFVC